jgi:hypothetical protein
MPRKFAEARMKTLVSAAVFALAFSAGSAVASDAGAKPAAKPASSKAVRMIDAELDRIVAGKATVVETGFNTWIFNPGNASVGIIHKDGSFTCINLCGAPPPPPPGGGGNSL